MISSPCTLLKKLGEGGVSGGVESYVTIPLATPFEKRDGVWLAAMDLSR